MLDMISIFCQLYHTRFAIRLLCSEHLGSEEFQYIYKLNKIADNKTDEPIYLLVIDTLVFVKQNPYLLLI